MTEYRNPTKSERHLFPVFCFPFLNVFCFPCFFLRHGNRRTIRRPSPSRAPLLRVRRGILRARRGDGIGGRYHQSAVLARGQLQSPRGCPWGVSGPEPEPARHQSCLQFVSQVCQLFVSHVCWPLISQVRRPFICLARRLRLT